MPTRTPCLRISAGSVWGRPVLYLERLDSPEFTFDLPPHLSLPVARNSIGIDQRHIEIEQHSFNGHRARPLL